jgi:hypothetical protein
MGVLFFELFATLIFIGDTEKTSDLRIPMLIAQWRNATL